MTVSESPKFLKPGGSRDVEAAGTKARGLRRVNRSWVPPFATATTCLVDILLADSAAAVLAHRPSIDIVSQIAGGADHVMVRSDSQDELQRPGEIPSQVVAASWPAVAAQIAIHVERFGGSQRPIVQRIVSPALVGAGSNERRFSNRKGQWVVEGWPASDRLTLRRLRVRERSVARGPLHAKSLVQVWSALHDVCKQLDESRKPIRFEWAWDGGQLWVLQADEGPEPRTDDSVAALIRGHGAPSEGVVRNMGAKEGPTAKMKSQAMFRSLGWPVVDSETLAGTDFEKSPPNVENWLQRLLERWRHPLVARTDVRAEEPSARLLLPTSAPSRSVSDFVDFFQRTLQTLKRDGTSSDDVFFILAPLVPAAASAFVRGRADSCEVDVDAIWGFPDGLLSLPHDHAKVDLAAGRVIDYRTRFKATCLILEDGHRRYAGVGPPWDWQRVLNPKELLTMGQWATELSHRLRRDVQLMCLALVDGLRGSRHCVPFHFTTLPDHWDEDKVDRSLAMGRSIVRSWADLEAFLATAPSGQTITLRPTLGLDRDREFLAAVGTAATEKQTVIDFAGSALGHAYYILRSKGAQVITSSTGTPGGTLAALEEVPGLIRIRMFSSEHELVSPRKLRELAPQFAGHIANVPYVDREWEPQLDQPGEVTSFSYEIL